MEQSKLCVKPILKHQKEESIFQTFDNQQEVGKSERLSLRKKNQTNQIIQKTKMTEQSNLQQAPFKKRQVSRPTIEQQLKEKLIIVDDDKDDKDQQIRVEKIQINLNDNEQGSFGNSNDGADKGAGFFGDIGDFFQHTVGDNIKDKVLDPIVTGVSDRIISPINQGLNYLQSTINEESEYSNDLNQTGYGWSTVKRATMDKHDWMKQLQDDWQVSQLFIPGTHDSGSCKTILESFTHTSNAMLNALTAPLSNISSEGTTQSMDIQNQLFQGIRAFDLRLGPGLKIYHGSINMDQDFPFIFSQLTGHLAKNPTEFIFLRIKQDTDLSFQDIANLQQLINSSNFIKITPQTDVSTMRGKLIVYDSGNISNSQNQNIFSQLIQPWNFKIQDDYNVQYYTKINILTQDLLTRPQDPSKINVDYASAYSQSDWPLTMAQKVNEGLMNLLLKNAKLNPSTLMMDFPSAQIINLIIWKNFTNSKKFTIQNEQGVKLSPLNILNRNVRPPVLENNNNNDKAPEEIDFNPFYNFVNRIVFQIEEDFNWIISDMTNGDYVIFNNQTGCFINFVFLTSQSSCDDLNCYFKLIPIAQQTVDASQNSCQFVIKNRNAQTLTYQNFQLQLSNKTQPYNISLWTYQKVT